MPATSLQPTFLAFLPVSLFGGIMGLTGLTFAWRLAHERWGVSFPLVAITIAAFHYGEHNPAPAFGIIAGLLLLLASVVIAYLLGQTIYRIATGTFIPVPPPQPIVPTT